MRKWDYMTNRKIRDTVFCHFMSNESHLLSLCNANDTSFEQQTLKLSDAFETQSDKLELAVHVYNLADGMNDELKRKCLPIGEYSIFSNAYKHVI